MGNCICQRSKTTGAITPSSERKAIEDRNTRNQSPKNQLDDQPLPDDHLLVDQKGEQSGWFPKIKDRVQDFKKNKEYRMSELEGIEGDDEASPTKFPKITVRGPLQKIKMLAENDRRGSFQFRRKSKRMEQANPGSSNFQNNDGTVSPSGQLSSKNSDMTEEQRIQKFKSVPLHDKRMNLLKNQFDEQRRGSHQFKRKSKPVIPALNEDSGFRNEQNEIPYMESNVSSRRGSEVSAQSELTPSESEQEEEEPIDSKGQQRRPSAFRPAKNDEVSSPSKSRFQETGESFSNEGDDEDEEEKNQLNNPGLEVQIENARRGSHQFHRKSHIEEKEPIKKSGFGGEAVQFDNSEEEEEDDEERE